MQDVDIVARGRARIYLNESRNNTHN